MTLDLGLFTTRPHFDEDSTKITSLTIRYDIYNDEIKSALREATTTVQFQSSNPFMLLLRIGVEGYEARIRIPMPLVTTKGRTRIARKSGWVEFCAPVADPSYLAADPCMVFPMQLTEW